MACPYSGYMYTRYLEQHKADDPFCPWHPGSQETFRRQLATAPRESDPSEDLSEPPSLRDPGPVRTRAVTGREYHCGSPDFIALTVAKLYLQPDLIRSPIWGHGGYC